MSLAAAGAVSLAAALDLAVGEPPTRVHPVALFGRAAGTLDREWRRPRLAGAVATLALSLGSAGVVALSVLGASALAPRSFGTLAAALAAGLVLFSATSLRMLLGETRRVVAATATDLETARRSLRSLAGRDASDLTAGQVRSAAVESLGENLADGLVAPLCGFAVGAWLAWPLDPAPSLALAAAGAAWVKAVNTLDSMFGYRERPFGWAPARLDDAVVFVPARLTAALVAVAGLAPASLGVARRLAHEPPSPNSGWPMGALAGSLGVRFEKPGVYTLAAGPDLPTVERARAGVRLVRRAGLLAFATTAGVVAWA